MDKAAAGLNTARHHRSRSFSGDYRDYYTRHAHAMVRFFQLYTAVFNKLDEGSALATQFYLKSPKSDLLAEINSSIWKFEYIVVFTLKVLPINLFKLQ